MRRYYNGDTAHVTERDAEHCVKMMLRASKEAIDSDTVEVCEFDNESPTDNSCTVDVNELLARGRVSYWYDTLAGGRSQSKHQFEIRKDDENSLEVTITDHANVLD